MSEVLEADLRRALIETVRAANAKGINQGTSGNASVRCGEHVLITPSGASYAELEPKDIVCLDPHGRVHRPNGKAPSSEWRFHVDILRERTDVNAVIHTHGRAVSTLACLQCEIPAFHYMVAVAGGDSVRCAEYATFGTQALSDAALGALVERRACLLANHGAIAIGANLTQALAVAEEVEQLADVYWRCLQVGEPKLLSAVQMREVQAQFAQGYGAGPAMKG